MYPNIYWSIRLTYYIKGLDNDTSNKIAIKFEHHSIVFFVFQNNIYSYKILAGGAGNLQIY